MGQPSAVQSLGLSTTPQLHYLARCRNTDGGYGFPSLVGYSNKLVGAYDNLVKDTAGTDKYKPNLSIDCANGVGAIALRQLLPGLQDAGLTATLANDGSGPLNEGCGADFVKIKQSAPIGAALPPGS